MVVTELPLWEAGKNKGNMQDRNKGSSKEQIFRKTTNPSFDTLPGCITYYGHPIKPNGPCETCKCNFICEKSTPKELIKIIFKEKEKCKKV